MVTLLGENTLLLMRASERGQLVPQLLEEVENMPKEVKPGLIKVKVATGPNQKGQVRFTLPSGQSFLAKPTQPMPEGSTALVQIRADSKPPQVLRVILPGQNAGQQNMLQQTTSPSVLMQVARQSQPRVGEGIQLRPAPQQQSTPNAPTPQQGTPPQPATAAQTRLPTPGAQVFGQVKTPPTGGHQTLLLANRTPLLLANPPVFEVGSNLTLRMTGQTSAVLEKLTPPQQNQQKSQQGQVPRGGQAQNQNQNRISHPTTQRATPKAPEQIQQNPQTSTQAANPGKTTAAQPTGGEKLLFRLQTLSPVPQGLRQGVQQVSVVKIEQNTYTLRTENGLELKVRPLSGQNSPGQTTQPNTKQMSTQQPTINAVTNNSIMSVRFSEAGLLDVLQVAEPKDRMTPYNQKRGTGGQTGGEGRGTAPEGKVPAPKLQSGHIATGTVTQQKSDGRLILQFEKGVTVEVQAQRLLPVGSKLSIQIMPDGHAEIIDMSLPKGTERSNTLMRLAVSWEGLKTAINELARNNPDTHQKLVNALPRANENLLPQLIQFSNAVAQQNLQAMLGDEIVNVLRALGLDGMLQTDLSQMNAVQQQRPDNPDSWRALLFPYWDEQEEQAKQGGFFWRRQHKDDAENTAPDEGTLRFVLNVEMSELGHTQLDGLMQEHESLYLKLRTQHPLTDDEKSGLRNVVTKSLEALDLNGQIVLENVAFFEVDPLHDMIRDEGGNGPGEPTNKVNVEA